ncbi:hypothetical protein B0T21DRAFT_343118 [Apiosordaria backusii]|uniref:Uncharacterized protein n=1 Tax=Apiosordaria backusii TaxID=314023 RepID=A0AA40EXE9_9PEZI|nr:hypothetical protein B0T21DRAFT_343118 [Apiosordaria backusii]
MDDRSRGGTKRLAPSLCLRNTDEPAKRRRLTLDLRPSTGRAVEHINLRNVQVLLRNDGSQQTLHTDIVAHWGAGYAAATTDGRLQPEHIDCDKMFRDLKLYAGIQEHSDAEVESQVLAAYVEPAAGGSDHEDYVRDDESQGSSIASATTETGPAANVAEVDKVAAPTAGRDKEEPPSPQDEPDQPPTPQDTTPIYATTSNEDGNDVAEDVDNVYGNISESVSEAAKTGCEFSDNTEDRQQDSDDNSVVFISERSLALTDNDQASPGSYDSEADSEYGTTASAANSLQSLSAALRTVDDTERWEATCRLFCHNQAHTAHDQGAKLLGTKRRLRPYQMEAAYELLQRSFGGQFDGGIMALGTGLGKTVASLAAIAIMRLVELNNSEVKQDWDIGVTANRRHNGPGRMGPCPSGNPWSIECCCVAGSLSSKIALELGPGPSLILTPAGITSQFAGEATNYLEKQVQRPGSDTCIPFVDTIDVSANPTLARDIRDDILTGFIGDQPIYMAPKKGDLQAVPAFVQGSGSQMGYTAGQVQQLFRKHRLLVVSSSPLSLLAKGEDYRSGFAQAYEIRMSKGPLSVMLRRNKDGVVCCNVRSSHDKGHQARSGKILAKGNYVPPFYQETLNDQAWISNIERHLNKLCERARQLDDYAGDEGEMTDKDVVSRLHRQDTELIPIPTINKSTCRRPSRSKTNCPSQPEIQGLQGGPEQCQATSTQGYIAGINGYEQYAGQYAYSHCNAYFNGTYQNTWRSYHFIFDGGEVV